ncbi:MAG: hypothetical protein K0V04_41285 [Deltaproteobacteria bacterium]|nr:hypothetical protein [Deltaproteobacteria bacterium]
MSTVDRRSRAWVLGLALATAAACGVESHATPQPEVTAATARPSPAQEAARQAVVALFDAFAASDCDAIAGLLGGSLRARMDGKACADFLAAEPLRTVEVTHIGEARVDGRDPRSFFVTVSLIEAGRERPVILRINHHDDGPRVVSM